MPHASAHLGGAAQIFMDGDLVSKTSLHTVSEGSYFDVDLGVDRNIETKRIVNGMRDRGVLISRIGASDNVLKMRPPMPFSRANADQLLASLDECLAAV